MASKVIWTRRDTVFLVGLLAALALGLAFMAGPASATCPDSEPNCEPTGDTFPPDTSLTSYPPSITNQTSVTFTYSATEAPATFECRLDTPTSTGTFSACGGPTSATTDQGSKSYSGLTTNGTYTFHVRATDESLNTDPTPASRQFTIDTVPPAAPTINTRPPELVNTRTASWTFSSEPGATFQCSIDSTTNFLGCVSGQSFTVSSDGLHVFRVRAKDQAGNTGPYAEDSWTVDTVPPVASIQTGPSGLTKDRSVSFTFSSNEAGSFQCRLDTPASTGSFEGCGSGTSSGKSYSGLPDGAYTFHVRATDQAGNVGNAVTRSFTVDGTAPVVNITGGPEEGSTSTSRSPSFTFSASEAVSFLCKLDGAAEFTACSSPQGYSNLADGPHTFSVKGRDAAGNESVPVVRSWTVDTTPPSLSITSGPRNGAIFGPGSTQAWTFDAGDATEVQCKVVVVGSAGSYGPCNGGTSSHSVSGLSEGSYEFSVRARDSVGNEATRTRQFTIDATAPAVIGKSPKPKSTGISPRANVITTFSEAMMRSSLTKSTVKLVKKGTTKKVAASLSYPAPNKVKLDPTQPLERGATYQVTIVGGASGVKDLAGNALRANVSWSFKVRS